MRVVRVGLPALVGLLLLFVGIQQIAVSLRDGGTGAVADLRGGLVPAAIGVALLLVSLAIARRSRLGYLLGSGIAVLMVLASIAVIAIEIPYIQGGGLGAAFGAGFVVVAVVWALIWAGYWISIRRARPDFAAAWQPGDRAIAILLAGIVVVTPAAYLGLGAIEGQRIDDAGTAQARAVALIAGTSMDVSVVDVTVVPPRLAGATPAVEHLVVELSVRSAEAYALSAPPMLCMTDLATAQDPAYKFDVFCLGATGRSAALWAEFPDLGVRAGTNTFRVELSRGESRCVFGPGSWRAELQLAPQVDVPGDGDAVAGSFSITADFEVTDESAPPPSPTGGPSSECIASTISP